MTIPTVLSREWYVLHTRSRFENVVHEHLVKKSLESFLPRITVRSRRKDRKAMIQVPLFPGYIFVRTDLDPREHLDILKTVGAVRLIGSKAAGPIPVPEENIDSLKIMVTTDKGVLTGAQRFKAGHRIMVIDGPFAGVTGVFVRYKGADRVVVYVEVLGQFAAVEVSEDQVEILPEVML